MAESGNPAPGVPDDLISMEQAAERLNLNPRTIRGWIDDGRIRGWRLGPRLIKVSKAEVDGQLQPMPVVGDQEAAPAEHTA